MSCAVKTFGTLYLDELPTKEIITKSEGKDIVLGDTIPGKELTWISDGAKYVSRDVICTGVSWDHLYKLGLITGIPVDIDGKRYLCRSMAVGNEDNSENEWDRLLNMSGEGDDVWGSEDLMFWGQEAKETAESGSQLAFRVVRQRKGGRYRAFAARTIVNTRIGFRPVLERCVSTENELDAFMDEFMTIKLPCGEIKGWLVDHDDYDITISGFKNTFANVPYLNKDRGFTVIERSKIEWITGEAWLFPQ